MVADWGFSGVGQPTSPAKPALFVNVQILTLKTYAPGSRLLSGRHEELKLGGEDDKIGPLKIEINALSPMASQKINKTP
mgnify:CR=1 FL=1